MLYMEYADFATKFSKGFNKIVENKQINRANTSFNFFTNCN